jgi:hypothetical protein
MSAKTVFFLVFLATSCAHFNKSPDTLSNPEFKNIIYLQNPDTKRFKSIETVSVTNSGQKATILNTLPDLYRNVLKKAKDATISKDPEAKIYLSNLQLESTTRSVPFHIPYQDCKERPVIKNVPILSCLSYDNCRTTYQTTTVPESVCETKTREESRNVLYQSAKATIFIQIKDSNEKK